MDATVRPGKKYGYAVLLGSAAAGAILFLAPPRTTKPSTSNRPVTTIAQGSGDIQRRLQSMEMQISSLKSSVAARPVVQTTLLPPAPPAASSTSLKPAHDDPPELSEEQATERLHERIENRYALLERRFAEEPLDESGSVSEEQTIRQRVGALHDYELSKLECRYTMCRLEVKTDVASAADILSKLGFVEGGEIRRRQDGSFLIFAGRDGFPFQEVNRVD